MEFPTDHAPQEKRASSSACAPDSRDPRTLASAGAARMAMNAMSELMGVFTHDLSNPLQTIVMQLELLSESTRHDPLLHRRVQAIVSASQEFQTQVQGLADFVHRGPQSRSERDLSCAITSIQELLGPRLQERKVQWETKVTNLSSLRGCTATLEFVLIRTLIALAYETPRSSHHPLRLITQICCLERAPSQTLRLTFELRQKTAESSDRERLCPIEMPQLLSLLADASPLVQCTGLASGQLQIDVSFPPPE